MQASHYIQLTARQELGNKTHSGRGTTWSKARPLALSSPAVEAALERRHDLRGAVEALGVRAPDLSNFVLRGAVALGGLGHLLLPGREVRAPQIVPERARVKVALVHTVLPRSCAGAHRRSICLDRLLLLATLLHSPQDLVGTVEALSVRVPDLLHQLLRCIVALGGIGNLILLCREPHARQVLQEGRRVEVAKVTQVALVHLCRPPVLGPKLSLRLSTHCALH